MNKELTDKWVAALRSGEFKQTRGRLCHEDPETKERSYCCLGVACTLIEGLEYSEPEPDGGVAIDGWVGSLPGSVSHAFDIDATGKVRWDGGSLASMNDSGFTFDQIADVIDENRANFYNSRNRLSAIFLPKRHLNVNSKKTAFHGWQRSSRLFHVLGQIIPHSTEGLCC